MVRRAMVGALMLSAMVQSAAQAQDKLANRLPHLFGPTGLVVDSEAVLANGQTHSAHFNSAFQTEFTPFNIALASQLTALPLPSPASGFTYSFDPGLGLFTRSTQSFGPILAERAETIGKKKITVGFNFQRFTFDTIEGVDLSAVPAVFTHDNPAPGGRDDVVTTVNGIDARVGQFVGFLSYGLLDRLDVGLAIPILSVDLDLASTATIRRIGTSANPAIHFFRTSTGAFGDSRTFSSSGSASGLGDVILRAKAKALTRGHAAVAVGVDLRLPTGDEEDLLGSGAVGLRPFAVASASYGRISPHLNLGCQWNGKSVLGGSVIDGEKRDLPDQWLYAVGMDVSLAKKVTLAADVLGRRVIDSPRLEERTFHALDERSTFPDITFHTGSFNEVNGAVGLKVNASGKLLLDVNLLFNLNDAGLRDRVTPLVGFEYSF